MANPHNASRVIHHRELSSVSEKQCDKRQARRGGSKKNKKKRRRKIKEERYAKDRTRRKSWKVGRETRSVLAGQNAEERRARARAGARATTLCGASKTRMRRSADARGKYKYVKARPEFSYS